MVRRLSLASRVSGAESPVHGAEPFRGQVRTGCAATHRNLRHVGHRPAQRKMVCKGHPCIYAADGNPMAWFAPCWSYLAAGGPIANALMSAEGRILNIRFLSC
jgi:hypothetical protein